MCECMQPSIPACVCEGFHVHLHVACEHACMREFAHACLRCVCACAYAYVSEWHVYACACAQVHACVRECTCVCGCMCMMHVGALMRECVQLYVCVRACLCACVCVCPTSTRNVNARSPLVFVRKRPVRLSIHAVCVQGCMDAVCLHAAVHVCMLSYIYACMHVCMHARTCLWTCCASVLAPCLSA